MNRAFGRIIIETEGRGRNTLTFLDRETLLTAEQLLIAEGYNVVDAYWGYSVVESVEQALRVAEIFCR